MLLKKISYIILGIFFLTCEVHSQVGYCVDSSYRIKFIFDGEGATLTNNPDTTGKNYFAGQALRGQNPGIAVLKTTWGDSIIWAKKIFSGSTYLDCYHSVPAPDGTNVLAGPYGGTINSKPEMLICRMDTNGNVLWMKRYKYYQNHLSGGYLDFKPLLVTNNAIYFNSVVNTTPGTIIANKQVDIVTKLDLDGNILWSTGFSMNFLSSGYPVNRSISVSPALHNGSVIISGDSGYAMNNSAGLATFTKLNDTDGSFSESFGYKISSNTSIAGIYPLQIKKNGDNTFTLISKKLTNIFGNPLYTGLTYSKLDANLNPISNYFFENTILGQYIYDYNKSGQQVMLATDPRFGMGNEKYFFTLNNQFEIIRSRKFIIPNYSINPSLYNYYDTKLDDRQNLHFTLQAIENSKAITDYSRISNFAPNSTLGCFGKDTSLLSRVFFLLEKRPFAWDEIQHNVLIANNVPFTIQDAVVTKQLICKIVSYCDNIKITGPPAICINRPARYAVNRNNTCQKFTNWNIDTSIANIIAMEGDSAITLSFKKPFTGYLHAALSDCVIRDSFLIKAVVPKMLPLIKHADSLLCPGRTLTLTAGNGYSNYNWQGGTFNSKQFTVNTAGIYRISAQDSCGNTVTDSVQVTLSDTSMSINTGNTICQHDTAFISLPIDVTNINWQPSAASLLRNQTVVAYPLQTTLYTITAERQLNCPISRTSLVTVKNCPQTVYVPNSFTPNGDGLNDMFKPSISQPLASYRFTIYNRYGQKIFETISQNKGWDGTYQSSRQPMGGYVYTCSYRFNGGTEKIINGYFLLLH